MKQNKSVLIIFLSLILSCFFLSGDVFAYKQSDLNKFENTRKCIKCDLTDLNLSRVNLSRVNLSGSNLSGSNLSGSNLSGSNLSGSNLSGSNLSGVNLNGSNLKDVNLTYANLSEIIIDEKAFSTLDFSEFTFMNKSTLAEEAKKKKKQALRKKKKEQALRKKKKEQALRKKKKEQALRKSKKEQALRKKKEKIQIDGWKDFKFGMSKGDVKDISIGFQNNKKLVSGCDIKKEFEQGNYDSFYECFKIGNIVISEVAFIYGSEDELLQILLKFDNIEILPNVLSTYSKKYKLYKKANDKKMKLFLFENCQIFIRAKSNRFSIFYSTQAEAESIRDYVDGLKTIDDL